MTAKAMPHVNVTKLRALQSLLRERLASASDAAVAGALPTPKASVAAVFRWRECEHRTLELLFVRRSINDWDTWSGQVAFPGGRRQRKTPSSPLPASEAPMLNANTTTTTNIENDWESSLETAQRETLEEIGLDLTQDHVEWIGQLPPIQTHLRTFWVGTEVFFLPPGASFTPVIQQSEIADVFWVDVQQLYNPLRYQPLVWPLEDILPMVREAPRLKRVVQTILGNLQFGAINLPRPSTHALTNDSSGEAMDENDPAAIMRTDRHDFILWGLTLRMVADIFEHAKCPLPMVHVSPQFTSKRLGDVFMLLHRRPEVALRRLGLATVTATAAWAAVTVYSKL